MSKTILHVKRPLRQQLTKHYLRFMKIAETGVKPSHTMHPTHNSSEHIKERENLIIGVSNAKRLVLEDFNCVPDKDRDRHPVHDRNDIGHDELNYMINKNNLCDAWRTLNPEARRTFFLNLEKLLNSPKQNFRNAINCINLTSIYTVWLTLDKPILPRKCLIKEINGEPPEDHQRFLTDISRLLSWKTRHENGYKQFESTLFEEIEIIASNNVADTMKGIWIKETSIEKENSKKRLDEKTKWLLFA
ncbi:unnamed protein product [Mytilus coruscus]|uniref:Uncharacterized protein n=1 Tax=Mytilus coruscus TaxID=42192 RepID=A0A6J8ELZ7_MYTCO|nr:unnamed protein product [Mytilus coruscus]